MHFFVRDESLVQQISIAEHLLSPIYASNYVTVKCDDGEGTHTTFDHGHDVCEAAIVDAQTRTAPINQDRRGSEMATMRSSE
jgi:hypothetical protein